MSNFSWASRDLIPAVDSIYGKWGYWNEDAAKLLILASGKAVVSFELLAVTMMNESVFSIFPGPNKNNQPENFDSWDVGPFQVNVHWTKADIQAGFVPKPLYTEQEMFGNNGAPFFNGNPIANATIAGMRLKSMGRAALNEKFPKITLQEWGQLTDFERDTRRAVNYVGPKGREWREKSFVSMAPLFQQFFKDYKID